MEANEKVYASQQLICMLPPLGLKVLMYLMNWQKYDNIKYFEKQMCGFMHLSKEELELGIQTLIDNKLIDVCKIDDNWCFNLRKETIKKYYDVPMQTIKDHEGLKLSKEITWNKIESNTQSNGIDDMSEEEMKRMLLMIQARLNEKQEVKKVVVSNNVVDDLPW